MKIEQNTISRDWTVLHNGRRFFVNFTESDGQTLMLCNRNNWDVTEQSEGGIKDVSACVFRGSNAAEQRQAEENAELIEELIAFCIQNWDNEFMQEVQDELRGQKAPLETWR